MLLQTLIDSTALKCTVRRTNGAYVILGRKSFKHTPALETIFFTLLSRSTDPAFFKLDHLGFHYIYIFLVGQSEKSQIEIKSMGHAVFQIPRKLYEEIQCVN